MPVIKRGIIQSYDPAAHIADVQIAGSLAVFLPDVRVATDIPAAAVVTGRQCTVLFLDPSNQDEALVLTIQGATPPAFASSHSPIGGYYPGVLFTGIKTTPQVVYKGAAFTITGLACHLAVAGSGADVKVKIRRNGISMGEVDLGTTKDGTLGSLSVSVSDGDYFDIEITQVGTTPNEGSDLHWLVTL